MRSIQTRFGKDNPIFAEIMSYVQGGDDLHETLNILRAKKAQLPPGLPVVHVKDILPVDQSAGSIVAEKAIEGTIVDEHIHPDGFILQLPIEAGVIRNGKGEIVYQGGKVVFPPEGAKEVYNFDKIYIPKSALRRCWQHDTGKYGLSEVGVLLNNLVVMCHRHMAAPQEVIHVRMYFWALFNYFEKVASMLGSKRGDISQLGMSVRYPFSSKAVATLSNALAKNTVEIHETMAETLHVKNGDVVLVERFPCLGFMSVRPQRVHVTKDEMCRYTIRVSGNSLCSLGLDFDGDVIYIASFHTPEAKALLRKEFDKPNKECYKVICELNGKAGTPHIDFLTINDYNIVSFMPLTNDAHAEIVEKATGVKSHTGPVIATAYNLMRILENSGVADDQKINVAVEYFLDRMGNTVFKQKHGVKSLHSIVMDAVCMGDVEMLAQHGFDRETSSVICGIVAEKAAGIGVRNLVDYHKKAKEKGWSTIINRLVRMQNKIYFASRSDLESLSLLEHLDAPAVDVPSRIFRFMMDNKAAPVRTRMDEVMDEEELGKLKSCAHKEAAQALFEILDSICAPPSAEETEQIRASVQQDFTSVLASMRGRKKDAVPCHEKQGVSIDRFMVKLAA
jgi:hypothetical protein